MPSTWTRPLALAALAGTLALGACGDEGPAEPEREISRQDAEMIAALTADLGSMDLALRHALADGDPTERTRDFEQTRNCPAGGTLSMSGERTMSVDTATRVVSTVWESVRTHDACSVTRTRSDQQVTVTVDGSITEEGAATFRLPDTRGEPRTLLSFSQTRTGQLVTSIGDRTRTCDISVTQTFDPTSGAFTVEGTVCGRAVSRTREGHGSRG